MSYQIGVTQANMQDLADLNLDDPLWEPLSDFVPFSGERLRGDGIAVGTGLPQFAWRFNELTLTQLGTLLYYCSTDGELVASKTVYVQTRAPAPNMTDRVFKSYRAIMMLPREPNDMRYDRNRKYYDVTIKFRGAVEL